MALENSTNQPSKTASRRRNKKSTADAKAVSPPAQDENALALDADEVGSNVDSNSNAFENPHVKELQKNIRNVNKKLTGTAKVDAILAENPNVPLDDLINQRKINADQKAQVLKKPALQAQLKDYEDRVTLHKKIEEDFTKRLQAQKQHLQAQHEKELAEAREEAAAATKSTSTPAPPTDEPKQPDLRASLLILSRFLRAAAARRQESDDTSSDTQGFEGVLLLLYGGDNAAVDAAEKLIHGSSDLVPSTEGGETQVSFGRVKQLAVEYAPFATEEAWVDGVAEASSDPTITNAGLTELSAQALPSAPEPFTMAGTGTTTAVDPAGANAAGSVPTEQLEQSWISVPRAAEETGAPNAVAASAMSSNSAANWASEPPAAAQDMGATPASTNWDTPTNSNTITSDFGDSKQTESWADSAPDIRPTNGDGFHEVHHGRYGRGGRGGGGYEGRGGGYEGRGRGRGGFRGDRGRGEFRGRGSRGGFEGRGGRGRGGRGREAGAPAA